MSELNLQGLKKTYGKHTVIEGLNLTLESGKIYGLIGRNGAGKTTLLSMMACHAPVTGGTVTLDGKPIWEDQKQLDRICFARELNPVADNNMTTLRIQNYLKTASCYLPHWDSAMADRLVKAFGLDPKQKLGKLSKGQLSAVTIVTALASKAEFTFLDEPVAGLDIVARNLFYKELLAEYTETGRTFVISTHIIEEAADIMEEVLILNQGRILVKENTQALLNRCCHVSGLKDQVEKATEGLKTWNAETMGRSLGLTVMLEDGQRVDTGLDVTVQPVTLEKLFAAMCREV